MMDKKANSKEKKSNLAKVDWQFVAESYLAIAYSGIEKLKNYIHLSVSEKEEWIMKEKGWCRAYREQLLLIPIVWNIKHAIELTLKAHNVNFRGTYSETHNLDDLKKELRKIFGIGENNKDERFNEFEKLVDKYYKMKIFNCESLNVFDLDNTFLRYPEGCKTVAQLDLCAFRKVTEQEIDQLVKDIKLIDLHLAIPAGYQFLKNAGWNQFANPYDPYNKKILNSEDFYEDMRQEAEKSGTLDKLKPMPSQPMNEYTVTFKPFAGRCDEKKKIPRKTHNET